MTRRTLFVPTVIVVAALMACAAALLVAVREAQAALPGQNGRIAFEGYRDAGGGNSATEILTVSPDGGATRQLTDSSGAGDPAFAPDGSKIAYSGGYTLADRDAEIFVMGPSGENRKALTSNTVADYGPAWSPDGDKILFVRQDRITTQGGTDWQVDIWVMNADGSGERRLTDDPAYEGAPSWSPDGAKIAYQRTGVNSDIWTMNADGSGQRRLTSTPYVESDPDFSPDNTKLAFTSGRQYNKEEVYTMNLDGTALTNVTNTRYVAEGEPAWSPDGSKIAYTKSLAGNIEIFTKNADGSGRPKNVSNDPEHNASPDWGPRP